MNYFHELGSWFVFTNHIHEPSLQDKNFNNGNVDIDIDIDIDTDLDIGTDYDIDINMDLDTDLDSDTDIDIGIDFDPDTDIDIHIDTNFDTDLDHLTHDLTTTIDKRQLQQTEQMGLKNGPSPRFLGIWVCCRARWELYNDTHFIHQPKTWVNPKRVFGKNEICCTVRCELYNSNHLNQKLGPHGTEGGQGHG